MATRKSTATIPPIKAAVAYIRMSSDKQEASPDQQRAEIAKLSAKHGLTIVREYFDSGISGDATEKRTAFQKMIADAKGGTFSTILCWDQDRFGRFNSIEAGFWIHPLMLAGVRLVTVAQGPISWDDFAGRIVFAVQQEGKNAFLRDLARNSMRGKLASVQRGNWQGSPPTGYRVADSGRLEIVEAEAEIVRRIFALAAAGNSVRTICMMLNAEPGKRWESSAVRKMLRNPAYIGTFRFNGRTTGKYVAVRNGELTTSPVKGRNDSADWIIFPNHHPAIVDQQTFNRVQAALAARKKCTTPHKNGGGFLLTGLIKCAKCGGPMVGTRRGESGAVRYRCCAHNNSGSCESNVVHQAAVLEAVLTAIESEFLNPARIAKLKAALRAKVAKQTDPQRVQTLQRQLSTINAKLAKATDRLIECESDMLPAVQDHIRQLRAERDSVSASLRAAETPQRKLLASLDETIADAVNAVQGLRDASKADPAKLREALRDVVERIDVNAKSTGAGRSTRWRLAGGSVRLRGGFVQNLGTVSSERLRHPSTFLLEPSLDPQMIRIPKTGVCRRLMVGTVRATPPMYDGKVSGMHIQLVGKKTEIYLVAVGPKKEHV